MSLLLTPALAVFAPVLAAQTSSGLIHGQVTDTTGAVVPGAKIVAHSNVVGGSFTATSDKEGNYRFNDLPQGANYTIEITAQGFEKYVRAGLLVRAGLDITVDIPLPTGTQTQTVEVSGDPPLIDTQNPEQAVNLSGELLRNVPITGRHDWSDSLQITPGITSASSDAQGGQTYFLRGSENENHATLFDGMDVGSFQQNWPSNTISISNESLGDLQIKTGGNDASSPAAMGMVINLASPVGSDQFHGSLLWLTGPSSLNANNVAGGQAAASAVEQPDFAIGGPIKRQRAWFFASGRYIHRDDGISQTSTQTTYLRDLAPGFQPYANPSRGFVFLGDVSVQLTGKHRLMGLVQFDSRKQDANYQWYATDIAHSQYGGGAYGIRLISQWTPRLSTRLLASYNNKGVNSSLAAIGGVGSQPELDIYQTNTLSGGTLIGQGSSLVTLNNLSSVSTNPASKPTASADVDYTIPRAWGEHDVQAGFYLEPHELSKSTTYYANNGASIQTNAVLNNPSNPTQGYTVFSTQSVSQSSLLTNYISAKDAAWYVQDRWKPIPRLAITAGIRPDWISASDRIAKLTMQHSWNWAPRIAGTYVLTQNQRNVVRASWTKITDITNASYLNASAVGGTNTPTSTTTYYNPNGSLLNTIVTPGTTASATGRTFDPARHQGFVREWLVGYRTQLPHAVTLDVSYIDRQYRDRPAAIDTNQIYTATAGGTVWSGLVNPAFNNTYFITNNHYNWLVYQGYEVTVSQQGKSLQLFSTYTYSPDHMGGTWQPGDPASIIEPGKFADNNGIGSVRGYVTNSYTGDTRDRMWQRQDSRTGITWRAPWALRLSTLFTAQSGSSGGPVVTTLTALGTPYANQFGPATLRIDGRTVSNPLATAYRFKYADRGTGQIYTPWLLQWNALVGRDFRITDHQGIEADLNLYNLSNNGTAQQFVNGNNAASGTFGQLQNIQMPRSGQISVRYHF
ncbi:MAG: carboxypeptidase regulatory-like domain-containing protein [Janthinobacterium lividum]